MFIGHGYDAHRFQDQGRLVLGGVHIEYERGMEAHSDGDVVLHALCDALLGAAALGDIGKHFPDSDPQFRGIDSRILLRHVVSVIAETGYRPVNADITIIAQQPRLAPHLGSMRENIAGDTGLPVERVNIKATTTEKMGFEGRLEGISTHAVVLIDG